MFAGAFLIVAVATSILIAFAFGAFNLSNGLSSPTAADVLRLAAANAVSLAVTRLRLHH